MPDEQHRDRIERVVDTDALRREHVVGAVMTRIAAAPPAHQPSVATVLSSWSRPVLVAAAAVMIVASAALLRAVSEPVDPLADALGVPRPIEHFLVTGRSDIREWLGFSVPGQ